MRKMKQVALFVGLFFLITVQAFAGEPQVTLKVAGRFFNAPLGRSANVRLTAKVVKHEGNRDLDVSCDGDGMYASSGKSLEGDKEEKEIFDFAFNLLPGIYRCSAVLTRAKDSKTKEFISSVDVTVH